MTEVGGTGGSRSAPLKEMVDSSPLLTDTGNGGLGAEGRGPSLS